MLHHCTARASTILRRPEKYGKYVRTLIIVSQFVVQQVCKNDLVYDLEKDDQQDERKRLSPRSLALVLAKLPSLSTVVWASDRAPMPQMVPLLSELSPFLTKLAMRPAQITAVSSISSRWDGGGISQLTKLKHLSVSHLSSEGIKALRSALGSMISLSNLTVDSRFADDQLLKQVGDMAAIENVSVRCTGTKITDKGILWLMENSFSLQSLNLVDFEGRLSKNAWSSIDSLPNSFAHFRISFAEEGPHHSWVADHIDSMFTLLSKTVDGLKTFSITTNAPKPKYFRINGTEQSPTPADGMQQVKCLYLNPCDPLLRPRKLPAGALERIQRQGKNLQILELDLFPLSIEEVRVILDSCRQLRTLRILLDAPLTRLLSMSSTFVPLQHLHTLYVSVTDAFCPTPYIIQTLPEDHAPPRNAIGAKNSPTLLYPMAMPDLSPASAHTSLSASEHEAISPSSSPQMHSRHKEAGRFGQSSSLLLFNGPSDTGMDDSLGCINKLISSTRTPDVSLPPKRDIRKLARRCPTLKQVKWYGRTGKGDWLIDHSANSKLTAIQFVPIYMTNTDEGGAHDLIGGGDIQSLIEGQRIAAMKDASLITNACQNSTRETALLWQEYEEAIEAKLAKVPAALLDDFDFPMLRQQHNDDIFTPTPTTSRFRQNSIGSGGGGDMFSPLAGLFSRTSFQSFEQHWPSLEEPLSPSEVKKTNDSPSTPNTYGARRASSGASSSLQGTGDSPQRGRRATMSSGRTGKTLQTVTLSSLPSAQMDGA